MTRVSLQHLTKTYAGTMTPAIDNLNLDMRSGELTALLGPSGCGKTTTMKVIAGLLAPSSGDVQFDGRSILRDKPENRGVVMVFQNHLLFPYMSVADNIGFGLKMRGVDAAQIRRRVAEMLDLVQLPDLGARKPSELSGGQQQRVALARALIVQPQVLLLDEPLSNLDAHLRLEMRDLIRNLQQNMGITTIFVTHDQEEAAVLADRVALILDGRMKQYDRPKMFYDRPVDEATARFFGGQNFVRGTSRDGMFTSPLGPLEVARDVAQGLGVLTFRPENVQIGPPIGADASNLLSARLVEKIYLGTQTRVRFRVDEIAIEAVTTPNAVKDLRVGEIVPLHLPIEALWVIS